MVKTSSGLGFRVYLGPRNLSRIAKKSGKINLHTHLEIKEDSFELYGFLEAEERDFFQFLTTVSGVGPSIALSILEAGSLAEIKKAIDSQNEAFFSQAHGIGQKRAQKIIFELKNKVSDYDLKKETVSTEFRDALEALEGMGYSKEDSYAALQEVSNEDMEVEKIIKEALKRLG